MLSLLAIYSSSQYPTQYPTTYLRERLPLSDWYFSGRGARAASGNDRPRTGDPCSCLAVHLDRTDFASGSTVHVDEFTCAFRHRRIRQSWREREREGGAGLARGWLFPHPGWAKSVRATRWTKRVPAFNVSPGVRKISQETLFRPPIDLQKLPPRWSSVKGSVSLEIERVFVQERRVDRSVVLFLLPSLHSASLSHRLPHSSNSPFKWIVYSGCCVSVHIAILLFDLTSIVILYYALYLLIHRFVILLHIFRT